MSTRSKGCEHPSTAERDVWSYPQRGCEGMATTLTTAHQSIWRHLYDSINATRTPKSTLDFVTLDKKSKMNTLWQREEFLEMCSEKKLMEEVVGFEEEISLKNGQQACWPYRIRNKRMLSVGNIPPWESGLRQRS